MTDDPIDLDEHHGMTAQKATEIRRRLQEVQLDQAALRARQAEFEQFLLAAPAMTWPEVAEKARYLFQLYAATADAEAPRAEYAVGKDLNKSLHVPGNPAVLEQSESIFNRDIPWLVFHFAPLLQAANSRRMYKNAKKKRQGFCGGRSFEKARPGVNCFEASVIPWFPSFIEFTMGIGYRRRRYP